MSALKNASTDRNLLIDVIAKCFNNYKDIDKLVSEALPMFDNDQGSALLQEVFDKITTYPIDDVFTKINSVLDESTSMNTLINIAEYAVKYTSATAIGLYMRVLDLSFEHDNLPNEVAKIISFLSKMDRHLHEKDVIMKSLFTGFEHTTSEAIEEAIVYAITQHKWTKRFKKLLKDNSEKSDRFNKLAK